MGTPSFPSLFNVGRRRRRRRAEFDLAFPGVKLKNQSKGGGRDASLQRTKKRGALKSSEGGIRLLPPCLSRNYFRGRGFPKMGAIWTL